MIVWTNYSKCIQLGKCFSMVERRNNKRDDFESDNHTDTIEARKTEIFKEVEKLLKKLSRFLRRALLLEGPKVIECSQLVFEHMEWETHYLQPESPTHGRHPIIFFEPTKLQDFFLKVLLPPRCQRIGSEALCKPSQAKCS